MEDNSNKLIQIGSLDIPQWTESRRRVYSPEGCAPTLNGIGCGGNTEPKIIVINKSISLDKGQINENSK